MANGRGNTVSVISGQTNTVVATIRVPGDPDAVAVNPKTDTVYVADAVSNKVSVINGQTNTVVATIRVGRLPQAVAVNPKTGTVCGQLSE